MPTASLPILSKSFNGPVPFRHDYQLLPFDFDTLDDKRHLLTNLAGEYVVLPKEQTRDLIEGRLATDSHAYRTLKARHFLFDSDSTVALDLLATKYRTKNTFLNHGPGLFIFVVTLRCEHSCAYCQVSRRTEDKTAFDMTREDADRAVDIAFQSPSPVLKIEFQGGESLLNFPLIQHIVERAETINATAARNLQFVIATNLALVTREQLEYCAAHKIYISTSLDGPAELHNKNRPRRGRDSHQRAVDGIGLARSILGFDAVSALMTTTPASLEQPEAIVDEYVSLGFQSVFLRPISPYGFAIRSGLAGADVEAWLAFYQRALARIFQHNYEGRRIREEYTAILARKILTPYTTAYVDLQSPTGLGLSCLVFNYDGAIHLSDESRMLAEMGDNTFRIGHVRSHDLRGVFCEPRFQELVGSTLLECVPVCSECPVRPWCGTDPVYHHATTHDVLGMKPTSSFCRRNMTLAKNIISMLEDAGREAGVLRDWAV